MTRTPLSRSKVKGQLVADVLSSQHAGTGATWRINTKILSTCRDGDILCRHAHSLLIIICVDDVLPQRGYCDHFVTMCVGVYVCGCVCLDDKTKTPDRNDLKLGTVVILDSLSKSIDFRFKRSRVRGTRSASLRIFGLSPNA